MESNPELCAEVAVEVMGWHKNKKRTSYKKPETEWWHEGKFMFFVDDFTPDIKMGLCWDYVVKKMVKKGFPFEMHLGLEWGSNYVGFGGTKIGFDAPDITGTAVCEAALEALGGKG